MRSSFLLFSLAVASAQTPPVLKILADHCAMCHTGATAQGKLRVDSFANLAQGGGSGAAVVPGNAAASPLYSRLIATGPHRMPPGAPLPAAQIATLKAWIDSGATGLPRAEAPAKVDFATHVEPILKKNCFACHSGAQPKSQLRLDAKAAALRGGLSGPVIIPGDAAKSRLIHRVEGAHGEQRMPLKADPLKPVEIAVLKKWIDTGAVWPGPARADADTAIQKHWSYRPPVRPVLPSVRGATRNPIDAFLLARLEKQALTFSPEASRETLIRRLSFDLTGLPPSPAEVQSFVADSRPDAYEQLVERLLASPHYGERWARPWLDLARYADTNGYEKDRRRTMWKYRDWVIDAFNRDLGFDQFTIEQIAGDMLPEPTTAQRIATGFHRNTMYNEEGGVDKEEAHFEVLVDRVNTTATVWLGSTMGCTQCHNHKYDPFTQRDYYSMMAFFSNASKSTLEYGDTSTKFVEPTLDLATPAQETQRKALRAEIDRIDAKLKQQTPELDREQAEWENRIRAASAEWSPLAPRELSAQAGTQLTAAADGVITATGENPQRETYRIATALAAPRRLTALRLEALPDPKLPRGGPGRDAYGNFIISDVTLTIDGRAVEFKRVLADNGRTDDPKANKQLWTVDASKEDTRLARQLVLVLAQPLDLAANSKLEIRLRQDSDFLGQSVGRFRLSLTAADDPSWIVKARAEMRAILETPAAQRTPAQQRDLAAAFRAQSPSLAADRDRLKDLRQDLDRLGVVTALVLEEKPSFERPFDFIRTRGGFASKADKVYANAPAALGPLPESESPNRLGLARWLVSRDNPLTARVTVNRIWEQYFGRGLVETSEDFGSQGAAPSHPELLDWLAVEFMDRRWSMKAMHRLIVTSAAYRQTSRVTPALIQADPYNRLISRGPRFRLEAEMVRDLSLAASGLLARKVGGPSVFPPQPPGIWDVPYSDDKWEESKGEDKFRRGLYTFTRRSALYPAMMNFDATSREFCTVRRIRTNTPLQALTTLNDAAFFETAQALGRRILTEGGSTDRSRIDFGFRLATGRAPNPQEADRILGWLAGEQSYFAAHAAEAARISGADAAQAPWTMFANVLLNLDETLTKE